MIAEEAPINNLSLGCCVGGGIVAAYNDKLHPNIIEGEMPLNDSSILTIADVNGNTYKLDWLAASEDTFMNYWAEYENDQPDPYKGSGTGHAVP